MAEPAKKMAERTEGQLDRVAETVRQKFDRLTGGTFAERLAEQRARADRAAEEKKHGDGRRAAS